jgi:predicted ATPase/DNA-binding SARP family transcriptional activator
VSDAELPVCDAAPPGIDDDRDMGIRAFGAIAVEGPTGPIAITGARERAVLGLLIARAGRVVADDVFVDELWDRDADPASARKSLRVRISRVRRPLAAAGATIEHVAGGYRLVCSPRDIDVERFRTAARACTEGAPVERVEAADRALDEWVDEPFTELRYVDALASVRAELGAVRRDVVAVRAHAYVDLGDPGPGLDLVLAALTDAPGDETLVRAAMRSLAAAGRNAEALEVYGRLVSVLADRGLEPSALTREFEERILVEEPLGSPESVAGSVDRVGVPGWRRPLGRDEEIDAITRLLSAERLVTVLGPGGVGKTRVAADVASRISGLEAVWWVSLPGDLEGIDIVSIIGSGIGARFHPGDEREDSVAAAIGSRRSLLVLDGAEHVVDDVAGTVRILLDSCPGLGVVVTSQAPLGDIDERRYRLSPMELPPASGADREAHEANAAVRLFLEVAERVGAPPSLDLASVAGLVRALDGLPLAIELAAAQSDVHSIDELMAMTRSDITRLDASHPGLGLVGTASWSVGLLEPRARMFLAELAAIPPGFSAELAMAVVSDPEPAVLLRTLVDRSLVEVSLVEGERRLHLLSPIRAAIPTPADKERLAARHLDVVVGWLDDLERLDAVEALRFVRRELHHFEAAFDHARSADADAAIRLASGLSWFWGRHGDWSVGARWYASVLELDRLDDSDPEIVIPVLMSAGVMSLFAGRRPDRAEVILNRLDDLARRSGRPRPFNAMSLVHSYRGDYAEAMALIQAQIDQDAETGANSATPMANLAHLNAELGNLDLASHLVERSKAEAFRHESQDVTHTGLIEAQIHLERGELESCREVASGLLEHWRGLGANLDHQVNLLHLLALAALDAGDIGMAAARLAEANDSLRLVDRDLPHQLLLVGEVARRIGRRHEAEALASEAVARLGPDEVLFPSRRRYVPVDPGPARAQPRHELLRRCATILKSVSDR